MRPANPRLSGMKNALDAASIPASGPRGAGRFVHPASLLLCSAVLLCAAAHADPVRKCHVDGRIVFQSAPCPPEAQPTTVAARIAPAASAASATDAAGQPKKKTLAEILRERDGADLARRQAREAQGDGANVLRSRMGAV